MSLRDLLRARTDELSFSIAAIDTADTHGVGKKHAGKRLLEVKAELRELQERLYAERTRAVLVVLVARVDQLAPPEEIESRYDRINRFEASLARAGVRLLKVMLHISQEEQRRRLLARLEDPDKQWKFEPADIDKRAQWADYQAAYDVAMSRCSTPAAPWYVVPADHKWYRNYAIALMLLETLREMDPRYPRPALDVPALVAHLRAT